MLNLKETKFFRSKGVDGELKKEYVLALKDPEFKEFVEKIPLEHDYLIKYTSRLQMCTKESSNCSKCKGLSECKNEIYGYKLTPEVNNKHIKFDYIACKYKEKELKETNTNVYLLDIPKEIALASMKDIFIDDKGRKDAIIWLQKFVKAYNLKTPSKGLYLHGNFGSGKTYLIAAALNELSKKDIRSAVIYWAEFLRDLKASFDDDFKEKFNYIKRIPILLIDDIGAESSTPWARDEILGPILQYRMQEHLTTFFTSNLSMDELEEHFSTSKFKVEQLKAKRIIERIRQLSEEMLMISKNNRK